MIAVYKCSQCKEYFYTPAACESHIAGQHTENGSPACVRVQFRCPRCGRVFTHWDDCKNHAMREHGDFSPHCEEVEAG